jgi:pimeloyl-ACP methyl ester carboxylesterase
MDVMGKLKFDEVLKRTYEGLYQTTTPTLVSWGMQDSYLPATDAQACAEATGKEFRPVPGQAGFLVQMDYAESVYNAIRDFVR